MVLSASRPGRSATAASATLTAFVWFAAVALQADTAVVQRDRAQLQQQLIAATGGDKADHVWLAVRTNPEAKKHAGISVLMASLRSPGVTIRPSMALYGKTFSAVFYDNVRVPAKNRVGVENGGWKVITDALAAERVMIAASSGSPYIRSMASSTAA